MEFDGRIADINRAVRPLGVNVKSYRKKDIYFLQFSIVKEWEFYWPFDNLVTYQIGVYFPNARRVKSSSPTRINYRLGSLFDLLKQ